MISGNVLEIYALKEQRIKTLNETQLLENTPYSQENISRYKESKLKDRTFKLSESNESHSLNDCSSNEVEKKWRFDRNVKRALQNAQRIINENFDLFSDTAKFFTLTFRNDENGNAPTKEFVKSEWDKFRRRWKRKYGQNLLYYAVIERGTRGEKRLHIHLVAFNAPYVKSKDLEELWGNGWVKPKKIRTDDIGEYLTKYITKSFAKGELEQGEKFYFRSRGLSNPTDLYLTYEEFEKFKKENNIQYENTVFKGDFHSDFIGDGSYRRIVNPRKDEKNETN
ncbi:hypothetical protein PND92_09015 [Faecalicoccus pleomorphus]|uniref:rolling circle replication-associated protein n=1 Tax=Faecalicoccus pleomorphus TaxID=1323 RepID=UPI00233038D8|nr:hypothetical protein [Faecalicoccus pleomorphus]MDB7989476.1 hypothetical protein [Faecalicoccus pleomorphus]MDB7993899.1 hypothetical protein [Faecalicoccus pleomorphus]